MDKIKVIVKFTSRNNNTPIVNGYVYYYLTYNQNIKKLKLDDQRFYLNHEKNQIIDNPGANSYQFSEKNNKNGFDLRRNIIKKSIFSGDKTRGGFDIYNIKEDCVSYINENINNHIGTLIGLQGFMKGSNPDGSQTYISKTIFLMRHEIYDKYRFVHLFKHLEDGRLNNEINYDEYVEISFCEFVRKYNLIESFELYNKDIIDLSNGRPISKEWVSELKKALGLDVRINDFETLKKNYEEDRVWSKKDRNRLRINVLNEYYDQPDQIFFKYPQDWLECAHIYNVKEIDIDSEGSYIADPNNGIMMHPTMHEVFDRNIFTFNENGIVVFRPDIPESLRKELFPNNENISHLINPERKFFINKRNQFIDWFHQLK